MHVKLNVDGSYGHQDGAAGAGIILRRHDGSIILTACRSLKQCASPLEAELCALMEGMTLAKEWSTELLLIETDSTEVLQMIQCQVQDKSVMGHLVAEAKSLKESMCIDSFSKVDRSQNSASHSLANYGRLNNHTDVWLGSGSDSLLDALLKDCNNTVF
jgi:ribonuclease HI